MSRRFWIIAISLAAHLGAGLALFASGVWHLDRLEAGRAPLVIGAPLPPPQAESGGSPKIDPFKSTPKIAKGLVQPEPRKQRPEVTIEREGRADLPPGPAGDSEPEGTCTIPPCGPIATAPEPVVEPPRPPDPPQVKQPPRFVSPTTLRAIRISGDEQIGPADATKHEMVRDGKLALRGDLLVCVAEDGSASATLKGSTGYPAYDARLLEGVRRWRYRPHTVGGAAEAVCGMVTFMYSMR